MVQTFILVILYESRLLCIYYDSTLSENSVFASVAYLHYVEDKDHANLKIPLLEKRTERLLGIPPASYLPC